MRSTPCPNDTLRTVNDARVPPRCIPITTPSKIWMRSLSPSRTFTCTLTVSPDRMAGRSASCDFSTSSIALMFQLLQQLLLFFVQRRRGQQIRPPFQCPAERLALAPPPNLRVVPRQQHVGHLEHTLGYRRRAAYRHLRRPRVVRKIEQP